MYAAGTKCSINTWVLPLRCSRTWGTSISGVLLGEKRMSSWVAFFRIGKTPGRQIAAQMIAPPRGHMQRPEDLFILDVAPGDRQFLRAEAQFAEFARHRIAGQLAIMFIDHRLAARSSFAEWTRPPVTSIKPIVPSS